MLDWIFISIHEAYARLRLRLSCVGPPACNFNPRSLRKASTETSDVHEKELIISIHEAYARLRRDR